MEVVNNICLKRRHISVWNLSLFQDPVPYIDIFTQFAERFSFFNPTCKKNSTFDQISDCFAEKSLKTVNKLCVADGGGRKVGQVGIVMNFT